MPTEKLFYKNSFATDFTATVTDCIKEKDYFAIVLDKTLFYPEGGGQPCDMGVLRFEGGCAEIFFTKEREELIYHHSRTEIPVGAQVAGTIDFNRRFDLMQQHTGEHMVSGTVHRLFGFDNVGFHLTDKDMCIDFNGVLSEEDIARVVAEVNAEIVANNPVVADYPDVNTIEYRSKKPLPGPIRIVRAGNADICACCGAHLETTGQVQMVAVSDSMNYKGGTRMFLGCGNRVFKDYLKKNSDCLEISHMLSAKIDNITQRVSDKIQECEALKADLAAAKAELFRFIVENTPAQRVGFISRDNLNGGDLQRLCAQLNTRCPVACVVSPQEQGGKICIISSETDTNKMGKAICAQLGGKGGGKPGIFQGTLESLENVEAVVRGAADDR